MSRFKKVSVPETLPAQCFFLGVSSPDKGPYLDIGLDFDRDDPFLGTVYMSYAIVEEICNLFEFSSPEQTKKMIDRISSLETELDDLKGENVKLRDSLRDLSSVFSNLDSFSKTVEEPAVDDSGPTESNTVGQLDDVPHEPSGRIQLSFD